MPNNYITYIVVMQHNFGRLDGCFEYYSVATMSSLAQLRVQDTKAQKQRQCRRDDARLTKSRNPKSEQLLVMPT